MSLATKLAEVSAHVTYLQKKGRNTQQGYSYLRESDVLEALKPLFSERGIVVYPTYAVLAETSWTNAKGFTVHCLTMSGCFKFVDGETGEHDTVTTIGQGIDTGDKAPFKAMTGCQKYAFRQMFLIPTGDDPEEDNESDKEEKRLEGQAGKDILTLPALMEKVGKDRYKAVCAELQLSVKAPDKIAEYISNAQIIKLAASLRAIALAMPPSN